MMKHFKPLLILLALVLTVGSCDLKDDLEDLIKTDYSTAGTYQLYMNDSLINEGTVDEVGMAKGLDGLYTNTVTLNRGTILTLMISGVSGKTGESVELNDGTNNEPIVIIGGWDIFYKDREEMFFSESGTVTRTSPTKISFEGKCLEMLNSTDTITFRGFYESESFQMIN